MRIGIIERLTDLRAAGWMDRSCLRGAARSHDRRQRSLHRGTRARGRPDRLIEGFLFEGQRVPLVSPQQGIFKPRLLPSTPLSVLTAPAVEGRPAPYEDTMGAFASDAVPMRSSRRGWKVHPNDQKKRKGSRRFVLAERVGFAPREPAPINDLGAIGNVRIAQIHSNPEYQVQNRYSATVRGTASYDWPATFMARRRAMAPLRSKEGPRGVPEVRLMASPVRSSVGSRRSGT
jgi:hypothetical protein